MYTPEAPPTSPEELGEYLARELSNIAQEMNNGVFEQVQLAELHNEPVKPRNGMVARADGTNWNPASGGAGIYSYIAGSWVKL